MKTETEIREILDDLNEALKWALENRPVGLAKIESLNERVGLLEYILGDYDE